MGLTTGDTVVVGAAVIGGAVTGGAVSGGTVGGGMVGAGVVVGGNVGGNVVSVNLNGTVVATVVSAATVVDVEVDVDADMVEGTVGVKGLTIVVVVGDDSDFASPHAPSTQVNRGTINAKAECLRTVVSFKGPVLTSVAIGKF